MLPQIFGHCYSSVRQEVLGDHILVSVWRSSEAALYLVSWKTGVVTLVSGFSKSCLTADLGKYLKLRKSESPATLTWSLGKRKLVAVVINSSLIALMKDGENSLEVCRLEIASPGPRLQTLCFLELPPLVSNSSVTFDQASTEWVPTSKDYARSRSSRGHHLPFYSSTVRTIGLLLDYWKMLHTKPHSSLYAMIISVPSLLSSIRTDVRNVPWVDWGPSGMHISIFNRTKLRAAGPFWITHISPLTVHQYDPWRALYTQSMAGHGTSWLTPALISTSTESFGYHWKAVEFKIKTYLRYRQVKTLRVAFQPGPYTNIVADREWIIEITRVSVCGFCLYIGYP
jgi:hypothetical protein